MNKEKKYAPVVLFVYRKLDNTKRVVDSLKNNPESKYSQLIIFSDGPKGEHDIAEVEKVRSFLLTISGFLSINIIIRDHNLGLSNSLITGITETLRKFESAIFIEDDSLLSPFFLNFMNSALDKYENFENVICISGYSYPQYPKPKTPYFLLGAETWSMGTWRRGWANFENDSDKLIERLYRRKLKSKLNMYGFNFYELLLSQQRGEIDSWGVRWWASAVCENLLCLYPPEPHCINIGFNEFATHTKNIDPTASMETELSKKATTELPHYPKIYKRQILYIRFAKLTRILIWYAKSALNNY